MAEPDMDKIEKVSLSIIRMAEYLAEEECKKEKIPTNILPSIWAHLLEDAFKDSVESIASSSGPQMAVNFIEVVMGSIQEFVKLADGAHKDLTELAKKFENEKKK